MEAKSSDTVTAVRDHDHDSETMLTPSRPRHWQATRSSIWYYDGSIVLQAEDTQFCVHGGVLRDHSTVFRDLLSLPQGTNPAESVDGCPLVHVSDTAQELAHLLHALYDPAHRLGKAELCQETHLVFCAVLRLSTKYMIAHLRAAAAEQLYAAFPSGLEEWRSVSSTLPATVHPWELEVANTLQACELLLPLVPLLYRIALRMPELEIYRSHLSSANKETLFGALPVMGVSIRYTIVFVFEHIGVRKFVKCASPESGKCRDTASEWLKEMMKQRTGTPVASDIRKNQGFHIVPGSQM